MSALGKRMPVELFTDSLRITGSITTHHIHVRDELNDTRLGVLIFDEIEAASLQDIRTQRFIGREAWLEKEQVLLAVPYKIKGTTSMLTQRSIQSRLGKNEHRVMIELPPFRVIGNVYAAGKFRIQDVLRRESAPFVALTHAQIVFVPDANISLIVDEVVLNRTRVNLLCSDFESKQA